MADRQKPKWGYERRPEIVPFHFTKPDRTELLNTLGNSFAHARTQALITELEKQISEFMAYEKLEDEEPRRKEITAALDDLDKYAGGLAENLERLDIATREIITAHLPEPPFHGYEYADNEHHNYIELLTDALENFRSGIMRSRKDDPNLLSTAKGGCPKGLARRTFAINVAIILEDHIDQKSAATRDGLYESILCICLSAMTGKTLSDVHELACEALKKRNQVE